MEQNTKSLSQVLAFATTVLATEHFFTFALSSLPTTSQFFKDNPEPVRKAYTIAFILSNGFGALLSYMMKSWVPIVSSLILSVIFIILYEDALKGGF